MSLLAIAPALPLHAAGKYVAGAYIVFIVVILVYVVIMAVRLGRTEQALVELGRDLARRDEQVGSPGAVERPPDLAREPTPAGRPGDSSL